MGRGDAKNFIRLAYTFRPTDDGSALRTFFLHMCYLAIYDTLFGRTNWLRFPALMLRAFKKCVSQNQIPIQLWSGVCNELW